MFANLLLCYSSRGRGLAAQSAVTVARAKGGELLREGLDFINGPFEIIFALFSLHGRLTPELPN